MNLLYLKFKLRVLASPYPYPRRLDRTVALLYHVIKTLLSDQLTSRTVRTVLKSSTASRVAFSINDAAIKSR